MTVIGMIHLKSLPGTPMSSVSVDQIVDHAVSEGRVYQDHGVDGVMIENMNDVPYSLDPSPETGAIMTRVGCEMKREVPHLPLGVQILATRNREAMAVALASGCHFIRVENFVFSHIADEGLVNSDAAQLLRYRKFINCENVAVFTDIKKKHSSHSLTSDVDVSETGKTAEFFMSDGLILTGSSTGSPVNVDQVKSVSSLNLNIPTIIGSGANPDNLPSLFTAGARAAIVGSYFKKDGHWRNDLDSERIKRFIDAVHNI